MKTAIIGMLICFGIMSFLVYTSGYHTESIVLFIVGIFATSIAMRNVLIVDKLTKEWVKG